MRILVTGRDGQVARSLAERAAERAGVDIALAARPKVDLAMPGSLAAAISISKPDLVINAAAFTAVDLAETEEATAHRINAEAAREGAAAAAEVGVPFVQLSTDYVFDGSGERAWREDDPVAPLSAYGRTKAEGERQVLSAGRAHLVIRTSWVVSPFSRNFVRTMLRLAAERETIAVVADQRGRPTSAIDLADALLAIAPRAIGGNVGGIWHIANGGEASWADLAEEVMRASRAVGGPHAMIERIATAQDPTTAPRPANSVLDCGKVRERLGIALPDWRGSVDTIVRRFLAG